MDEQMNEAEFINFCEHIKVEDNSILVFKVTSNMTMGAVEKMLESLSNIVRDRLKKKAAVLVIGPDIDNISMVPEEEMNRVGWFRKDNGK